MGYDISRTRTTELLKQGAIDAELQDPFVRITSLGDFCISYRVSGFLQQVETLISKRTELHASVLDRLHGASIEIVSPGYMNQRQLEPDKRVIPPLEPRAADVQASQPEDLMFDKAELAACLQKFLNQKNQLEDEKVELEKELSKAEESQKRRLELDISWRQKQILSLDELLSNASPERE